MNSLQISPAATPGRHQEFVDVAKGIGILLVVLGHNAGIASTFIFYLIFSFHVPLFFFLSGLVFKAPSSLGNLLGKKFHSVLWPFYFTIIIIHLMLATFSNMKLSVVLNRAMTSAWFAGSSHLDWVQLWYLPHLFVVFIFGYLFIKLNLITKTNTRVRWGLIAAMLVTGFSTIKYFWPVHFIIAQKTYEYSGLPYSLDLLLITGFFFLSGYECAQIDYVKLLKSWTVLILSAASLISLNYFFQARMDISKRVFDSFWINTLEACFGICFILALSYKIDQYLYAIKSFLGYLGRISLYILIFHLPLEATWWKQLLSVTGNAIAAISGSFMVSVLASVLIFEFFVKTNPVASQLFGRKIPSK